MTRKTATIIAICAAFMLVLGTAGGAVAGKQITSNQIKNKTIKMKDLNPKTKSHLKAISNYEIVKQSSDATAETSTSISASCPHPNQKILSVSARFEDQLAPTSTSIVDDNTGTARTDGTGLAEDDTLVVQIVCAWVS